MEEEVCLAFKQSCNHPGENQQLPKNKTIMRIRNGNSEDQIIKEVKKEAINKIQSWKLPSTANLKSATEALLDFVKNRLTLRPT